MALRRSVPKLKKRSGARGRHAKIKHSHRTTADAHRTTVAGSPKLRIALRERGHVAPVKGPLYCSSSHLASR
eukprot:scaffold14217_cov120-Isochrysis_galbana.AAC.5